MVLDFVRRVGDTGCLLKAGDSRYIMIIRLRGPDFMPTGTEGFAV
mgnify:CR=1 FL=1